MMGGIEAVGSILNSYPLLWAGYGFLIFIPLVAIVSYFFWPKDSASYSPPKATATTPTPEELRAKDDISGRDSGIEASGETERGLRVSTSSDDRDQFSRTPDSLRSAEEEGPRTDSALGDPEDSQKPSNRFDIDKISVEVTDALEGPSVRFRGSKEGKRNRSSTSPSSTIIQNGITRPEQSHVEESLTEEELEPLSPVWKFPPTLDDFDLMESDVDPSELEEIFADDRLIEVKFRVNPGGPGVGISIVGGSGSPNGDLPILVKRVLPGSLAEENGHLKAGDELVAVNETLLVGMEKDFAINALSRMEGDVRLLVLQDD